MAVTLTPVALDRVQRFLQRDPTALGLRFGVERTGCSGWGHVADLARDRREGDAVFEQDGVRIFVDAQSLPLVDGTRIDFTRQGLSETFVFDNLNYDTASNALTPESKPTIDTLVLILKAYPNVRGRVVGYTDNQGDPAANKTLSDARAATVKKELSAQGIAGERIETAGMGEADPIADNATEEGRAKNRRTELVIVRK